jgi:drug/metabolite transporter (DMT)-like permease
MNEGASVAVPGKRDVDLALLGVAAVWGASYLVAKDLTEHASVTAVLALRFTVAAIALAGIWLVTRPRIDTGTLAVGGAFGATLALILYLETAGVARTSATNAGLIISLAIIFTPLLDGLAARQHLPRPFFVVATGAIVGVALLVSGSGFQAPTSGDALVLAAALVRAFQVTAMGHSRQAHAVNTLSLTLVQNSFCALVFLTLSRGELASTARAFERPQWMGVLFLGIACGALAFLVQLWAIRRTSPSRASLLLGTEPIWAVVVGVTLGGEHLNAAGLAGAVLIIVSTYAGQLIESRHRAGIPADYLAPEPGRVA